jgi:hypothetical protein
LELFVKTKTREMHVSDLNKAFNPHHLFWSKGG